MTWPSRSAVYLLAEAIKYDRDDLIGVKFKNASQAADAIQALFEQAWSSSCVCPCHGSPCGCACHAGEAEP